MGEMFNLHVSGVLQDFLGMVWMMRITKFMGCKLESIFLGLERLDRSVSFPCLWIFIPYRLYLLFPCLNPPYCLDYPFSLKLFSCVNSKTYIHIIKNYSHLSPSVTHKTLRCLASNFIMHRVCDMWKFVNSQRFTRATES